MENEKLSKAKSRLIVENPFFASILLSMVFIEDKEIKTFATDGETIRYNLDFLETLTVSEVVFVLAHEILHCVFQHMFRLGEREAVRWNKATDYIINGILSNESGVGTMPNGGLLNPKLVADGGGTADGVYRLLPDETNKNGQGAGNQGAEQPLDELIKPSESQAEMSQKETEMKVRIAQARNAAKMRGNLSAGLERLIEDTLKTDTDWKTILRNFMSSKAKTDFSFAKPKRRFLAEDICLPSLIGEKLGGVAIAIDCSGSVDAEVLAEFETEIKAIAEDCLPSELNLIYFDAEVLKIETVTPENYSSLKLNPIGGGGTDFAPIFESILKLETMPIVTVVLTDLCCNSFGVMPDCPVLWASTEKRPRTIVPFGETIYLRKDR